LAIAVLGAIMFIMTAIITMCLCCCMHCLGIYLPEEIGAFQGTAAAPVVQPQLASSTVINKQAYYPPRPQVRSAPVQNFDNYPADPYSRYSALPYPPVRYNSVPNPYGSGAMFGNFPYRAGGRSFAQDFMAPNPSSFWN